MANMADSFLTLREAMLLARAGTSQFTGLGRPLTAGEQGQNVGCSFDASGYILNGSVAGNAGLHHVRQPVWAAAPRSS